MSIEEEQKVTNTSPITENAAEDNTWVRMTREEINACPMRKYQGRIRVINSQENLDRAVANLEKETLLGFDTETKPTFRRNQSHPPALIQLAAAKEVFVIQLRTLHLPKCLRNILANPNIIKTGAGLDRDVKELTELAPFQPAGFVDVGDLAKKIGIKNHGLRGLAAVLLGFRISKGARTSNWAQKTLTPTQIQYAATDAWVGREVYLKLQEFLD